MICEFCGYRSFNVMTFMKHVCQVHNVPLKTHCVSCGKKVYSHVSKMIGYCVKCQKQKEMRE